MNNRFPVKCRQSKTNPVTTDLNAKEKEALEFLDKSSALCVYDNNQGGGIPINWRCCGDFFLPPDEKKGKMASYVVDFI